MTPIDPIEIKNMPTKVSHCVLLVTFEDGSETYSFVEDNWEEAFVDAVLALKSGFASSLSLMVGTAYNVVMP
jgi:hypothetical protein